MEYKNITFEPIWKNCTCAIIAGGASLTKEQVESVRGLKLIAINDAYKIAPYADILYACDRQWWDWHNGVEHFTGWRITHEQQVRWEKLVDKKFDEVPRPPYPGIDIIVSNGAEGFSESPDRIKHGGNSGYQAIHIAMHLGANKILLLGYDMHARGEKSHWFGEHPNGRQRDSRYLEWMKCFPTLELAARNRGQKIINCTPGSALECFEKIELSEALK